MTRPNKQDRKLADHLWFAVLIAKEGRMSRDDFEKVVNEIWNNWPPPAVGLWHCWREFEE